MPKKLQLPPQIPQSKDKLQRTISLLGNRIQAELKSKPAQELVGLLGRYVWKATVVFGFLRL